MNWQRIFYPIAGIALIAIAWRSWGWPGVGLVVGGIVMWLLLNFTRMTQVLQRAAHRPVGYVGSAVMLNAKLKPKLTLLQVIGLTRALGEQLSPKDEQPEIYRWTDGSASHVTCEFVLGKLVKWTLERPTPAEAATEPPAPAEPAQ